MSDFGAVELVESADQNLDEIDLTGKNKENPRDSYKKNHAVAPWVLLDSTSARERDNESFRGQLELLVLLQKGQRKANCWAVKHTQDMSR